MAVPVSRERPKGRSRGCPPRNIAAATSIPGKSRQGRISRGRSAFFVTGSALFAACSELMAIDAERHLRLRRIAVQRSGIGTVGIVAAPAIELPVRPLGVHFVPLAEGVAGAGDPLDDMGLLLDRGVALQAEDDRLLR